MALAAGARTETVHTNTKRANKEKAQEERDRSGTHTRERQGKELVWISGLWQGRVFVNRCPGDRPALLFLTERDLPQV